MHYNSYYFSLHTLVETFLRNLCDEDFPMNAPYRQILVSHTPAEVLNVKSTELALSRSFSALKFTSDRLQKQ